MVRPLCIDYCKAKFLLHEHKYEFKESKHTDSTNEFGSLNDINMCPQFEIDNMKFVPC